jgi:excinuclease ABC subunit B
MSKTFKLHYPFQPSGDQPAAIKKLTDQRPGQSVLVGVTGSGKTFTLANVIANQNKQVLILSPNKTLAAQLYEEFSLFFPENKVCYFVSYYDYYQPESYIAAQDIYIPKETKVNPEIERLRVEATASIITRQDTIVISSVSAIYSLGNPTDYKTMAMHLETNQKISRKALIDALIAIQYKRNDVERESGSFQVQGNVITIMVPYLKNALRIELFGDVLERLEFLDKKNYTRMGTVENVSIFPAKHFVTTAENLAKAIKEIEKDLAAELAKQEDLVVKERLRARIGHDIEMLRATGYCSGIENYSRYFDGREPGGAPHSLLDFFEKDFLFILDESHIAVPQLSAMYKGDKARKSALIEYGFRLPSAYDNRPQMFEEIETYFKDTIFVSATPGNYELALTSNPPVEQIVRPTGIPDPVIIVQPRTNQLTDLLERIKETTAKGYRVLVTTLTKKSAEELAFYFEEKKIKSCYLHDEIKTPDRSEILFKLRSGVFDVLIGINLLREGLDLPEVALVAILDADIQGFLRNTRSLIQTIGRAARNTESTVIFYADKITDAMREAMTETERRRKIQLAYNEEHGITAASVKREVTKSISGLQQAIKEASKNKPKSRQESHDRKLTTVIESLKEEMKRAAANLNFERAIELRSEILKLQEQLSKEES